MISVGSRDGEKRLSSRYVYGGGKMELETEIEEGEACFQSNNGEDSTIDPDISLSYIDEKIQDVLGHCQKDFEGGVSAENLGAKFGGYGSFLPAHQCSPVWPHPKTPPKVVTYSAPVSPNNTQHIEVGHQNFVSQSSASQAATHGPASFSAGPAPAPRRPSMNGKSKQEVPSSSATCSNKSTSNGQKRASNDSLKVRLKLGSDNMPARRNAEIYSGLGLDVSPSSSFEGSPVNSDGFFHVARDGPDESPTSILEKMTSFPVRGSLLLSPLPYDVLHLTENKWEEGSCGPVHKGSQESSITALHGLGLSKVDRDVIGEKKPKSSEKNSVLSREPNDDLLDVAKEEPLEPVLTGGSVGKIWEANNVNCDKKGFVFATKADSDASNGSKTRDIGLAKGPKQKGGQKATSREKESSKLAPKKEMSSSRDKKKLKGSRVSENGSRNVDFSKGGLKNDSSSSSKSKNGKSYVEDLKKKNRKARETYKDFFGELNLELENDEKEPGIIEKGTLESNGSSKERSIGKKTQKPSSSENPRVGLNAVPIIGNGPVSDAAAAPVAPLVNEDWVCCDKCEKWRLLPPGVNPGSLPEKWLCSMLDWLPGMNRCGISEEETTKAITSRFLGPPIVQGVQPVQSAGPPPGLVSVDAPRLLVGSQALAKKKQGSKDLPSETKQDRPSLSFNSAKKKLQNPHKSRSLNGGNRSPSINEMEFQDSGWSSDVIAEKNRLKHEESKKLCENFADEGGNSTNLSKISKISNKREMIQDRPGDCKKIKTGGNHGTDEGWGSDHGGAVFKASCSSSSGLPAGVSKKDRWKHGQRPKDTKPGSKISARNPENENRISSNDGTLKRDKKDVIKKRKANEFEVNRKHTEEMSETDRKKEKTGRVLKSGEERTVTGIGGAEKRGKNVKDEQLTSLDVMDSSKRDTVPMHASLAATSSSSKVSGSHKTKADNQGAKGSPVESVSSSPLRVLNPEKFTPSKRNKVNRKTSEPSNDNVNILPYEEKPKGARNKPSLDSDKLENVYASKPELASGGNAKSYGQSSQDVKQPSKPERGKSQLPPSGKVQNEPERLPQPVHRKENAGNTDALKGSKPNKKSQTQIGNQSTNTKQPTPDTHKGRDHDPPSPPKRETSNQAATNALRDATNLKHMADRVKNSGSNLDSRTLYMQAALQFLHVASLFESCHSQTGRYGDMIQSMSIYSSTAKLCEYCAHEYEKTKEMATAALAYKCVEVAYLKVVFSSHTSSCKDLHELQTSLQIGPTGESPSSSASASDLDNLNNPATAEKAALAKGVNSPQVAGNHVIAARNKPNFTRILNFAQDVNLAMEASRKSRTAFAASGLKDLTGLSAVKSALDFSFHDVEELLRLVQLAMEVINR